MACILHTAVAILLSAWRNSTVGESPPAATQSRTWRARLDRLSYARAKSSSHQQTTSSSAAPGPGTLGPCFFDSSAISPRPVLSFRFAQPRAPAPLEVSLSLKFTYSNASVTSLFLGTRRRRRPLFLAALLAGCDKPADERRQDGTKQRGEEFVAHGCSRIVQTISNGHRPDPQPTAVPTVLASSPHVSAVPGLPTVVVDAITPGVDPEL